MRVPVRVDVEQSSRVRSGCGIAVGPRSQSGSLTGECETGRNWLRASDVVPLPDEAVAHGLASP
jgi:hypothetical protein